ncbi:acyl-CoA thioesterase/BAAT N-terminal domain-containing protein [Bacillus sp. SD088]|nr:acyl-CoA thioesterase/BAAT N-terminal domain-containing protein [Bacillus sp. SD088]
MRIMVDPVQSLIDEPVRIKVLGLQAGQLVTIQARRTSQNNSMHFSSRGEYIADESGEVDLGLHPSIGGTYQGIDPMGLFWSLQIEKVVQQDNSESARQGANFPHEVTLEVRNADHEILCTKDLKRLWLSEDIVRTPIRENGLVATLFSPKDGISRPGVIFLSGSEGGVNEYMSAMLASHGFTTLALAYFGIEGLPERLANIPLEYVEKAITWMESQEDVKSGWLGIHGTSKGTEVALLSGTLFQQIKAVVALNGWAVSFAGIVPWSDAETLPPSWTYNGKPIPYATPNNPKAVALECLRMFKANEGNPYVMWYRHLGSDPEVVEKATIPVEKIKGPIMFITGQEDGVVPDFSKTGMERLKKYNHPYEYHHYNYQGGTHSIGIPYLFVANAGTHTKETALASQDSWIKTKEFFMRSFLNATS